MATASTRSNVLNYPINIFAVNIDGFLKSSPNAIFSEATQAISSYAKYMGYSHVLLLEGNTVGSVKLSAEKKRNITDTLHSNGIKSVFCLTPKDITDKKLYIYSILDQIKCQGFDGLFINIPLPTYTDKTLLKQLNKEIHAHFPNFITILGNKVDFHSKPLGFDMVVDLTPYEVASRYVELDPYFRKHMQTELEESIFSSEISSRIISRSYFESKQDFNSVFLSSYGSYSDKLMQKRAIDLMLVTACCKTMTLMGDEFSGVYVENSNPLVNWNLLSTGEYQNLRLFTRALNYFYLENEALYASHSLSVYSEVDKEKNVIAFKRSSGSDKLVTAVNLSGIAQSITIAESGVPECVFATEQYIGNDSIFHMQDKTDVYSITLPAFCGAVYRFK